MAQAQLAGEDHLVGLDRYRADAAGQALSPVPGLCSTTAAGLARRMDAAAWTGVERAVAEATQRMLALLPPQRVESLLGAVTIDMDTTDVEVYGRKKRGVAYTYQGVRHEAHMTVWRCESFVVGSSQRSE
jgi:hypothetical protein